MDRAAESGLGNFVVARCDGNHIRTEQSEPSSNGNRSSSACFPSTSGAGFEARFRGAGDWVRCRAVAIKSLALLSPERNGAHD